MDSRRPVLRGWPSRLHNFQFFVLDSKTPNDEENLKELKNEKMKWLYSELRREGIIVFDSTRKPPAWTFDKRVEIPEKAFETKETSREEEESVEEAETMDEYDEYEDIYK